MIAQIVQDAQSVGRVGLTQGFPQSAIATLCQRIEPLFRPPQQRRAQRFGQCKIVVGGCQKGQQGRQILDRQFGPEL